MCVCVFYFSSLRLNSITGMAQQVQRRATGWTAGVRFPAEARYLFFLHFVQSPEIRRSGREADYSPPTEEVKNNGAIPPLPHTSSWHGA
jgi:hypothetical protein